MWGLGVFVLTDWRTNICSYENKKFLALEITRQFTIFVECPSLNFNLKRYLKLHQLQVYMKVESLLILFSALRGGTMLLMLQQSHTKS